MTAFVSWSGGKDCSLALYSFLKNSDNKVSYLVNIVDSLQLSNTHHIGEELLLAQSQALNIPLIREVIMPGNNYESQLKSIIAELKEKGVDAGVFGDIHLKEHRIWIERVCHDMNITAIFPLWGLDVSTILTELLTSGFKTIIIAVKNRPELSALIGKELDEEVVSNLAKIQGVDLCGEHGEYHSFVYDSPLYDQPISFQKGELHISNNSLNLSLKQEKS